MAPKSKVIIKKREKLSAFFQFYDKYLKYEFLKSLALDSSKLPIVSVGIILAELILNIFIIHNVSYTEIDWKAYMQECEGFLNKTTNYTLLKGDTGPLVYPAGFVYIYTILYYLTSRGQNIRVAQYIFCIIYLIQMFLVLRLYTKSRKVPPYVLVLSAFTSYRIHSIYVLRLFNDPIAILFMYAALNLFLDQKWNQGSFFFSLGVSVKMNILLFAPAILLFYITNLGYYRTIKQLFICFIVQVILGAPFLLTYPHEYIKGSFNLGRVFDHKWTVNYRFLDTELFESKYFHINLLIMHVAILIIFAEPSIRYFRSYCRLRVLQNQLQPQITRENARLRQEKKHKKKRSKSENVSKEQEEFLKSFERSLQKTMGVTTSTSNDQKIEKLNYQSEEQYTIHFDKSIQLALLPIFFCNFIGIMSARSLHYQFYVWYFHSLPHLIWATDFRLVERLLLLGLIEFCWNTYPSTNLSSLLLHLCHLVIFISLGRKMFKTKSEIKKIK